LVALYKGSSRGKYVIGNTIAFVTKIRMASLDKKGEKNTLSRIVIGSTETIRKKKKRQNQKEKRRGIYLGEGVLAPVNLEEDRSGQATSAQKGFQQEGKTMVCAPTENDWNYWMKDPTSTANILGLYFKVMLL